MTGTRRGSSSALQYSLAEFSYILLFFAVGAAALLYGRYVEERGRAEELAAREAELTARLQELTAEVDLLNELLAEKRYGVVPCWRRPEGKVPQVAGTITLSLPSEFTLTRTSCGTRVSLHGTHENRQALLEQAVAELFAVDLAYAREKNCYLRMSIDNQARSFTMYSQVLSVLGGLGIIVANQ